MAVLLLEEKYIIHCVPLTRLFLDVDTVLVTLVSIIRMNHLKKKMTNIQEHVVKTLHLMAL
jgi:hypothetical protein